MQERSRSFWNPEAFGTWKTTWKSYSTVQELKPVLRLPFYFYHRTSGSADFKLSGKPKMFWGSGRSSTSTPFRFLVILEAVLFVLFFINKCKCEKPSSLQGNSLGFFDVRVGWCGRLLGLWSGLVSRCLRLSPFMWGWGVVGVAASRTKTFRNQNHRFQSKFAYCKLFGVYAGVFFEINYIP